ncbi:MAG TPA: hypothetical protein PKX31_00010 [Chitinophagaceae bacterium]|nr:hypothetical protein [Chitinophagaceae bacterium]
MYTFTIDELIARLNELKGVATLGGATPVVVQTLDIDVFESAACELQSVIEEKDGFGKVIEWRTIDSGNTHQVVRIF